VGVLLCAYGFLCFASFSKRDYINNITVNVHIVVELAATFVI